ncbi:hypothetical protein ABLE93_14975 [Xanthobacter sp. KR7-65]|uniref:hypothetical protein n=1 Tax=Xanthobacter sp. KR7-65 TaxID=3156612 RepID=UPI0032B39A4F
MLMVAVVALFLIGFATAAAACRLASRLREVAEPEWRRLGSPLVRLFDLRLSPGAWRNHFSTQRLVFWALLTEGHSRIHDAELSRWVCLVRAGCWLQIIALIGAAYFRP